jgi:hypothetical protein
MPVYFAGWIRANATIKFGTGFTVTRFQAQGWYRITIPATATGKFLSTVATSSMPGLHATVEAMSKSATDGSFTIDILIRDAAGNPVDGDFNFIAMDRS